MVQCVRKSGQIVLGKGLSYPGVTMGVSLSRPPSPSGIYSDPPGPSELTLEFENSCENCKLCSVGVCTLHFALHLTLHAMRRMCIGVFRKG
eukprot:2498890-Pyramimonas_sp.AAC.1